MVPLKQVADSFIQLDEILSKVITHASTTVDWINLWKEVLYKELEISKTASQQFLYEHIDDLSFFEVTIKQKSASVRSQVDLIGKSPVNDVSNPVQKTHQAILELTKTLSQVPVQSIKSLATNYDPVSGQLQLYCRILNSEPSDLVLGQGAFSSMPIVERKKHWLLIKPFFKQLSLQAQDCELPGFDFSHIQFTTQSSFAGAVLTHAQFSHAGLKLVNFCDANLRGADFSYAQLELADFDGAILDGSTFTTKVETVASPTQELLVSR
jgi:hypothetical protein